MSTSRRQFLAGSLAAAGASLLSSPTLTEAARAATATPTATPAPKPLSSWDPQAKKLLAQLSLEEKVGQMTQPDQMYLADLDDLDKFNIG